MSMEVLLGDHKKIYQAEPHESHTQCVGSCTNWGVFRAKVGEKISRFEEKQNNWAR